MVDEWNFNNVRDTDERVLMADTEEKDQDLPDEVLKESIKRGLGNNSKKTMCVIVSKKKKTSYHQRIDDIKMKQV